MSELNTLGTWSSAEEEREHDTPRDALEVSPHPVFGPRQQALVFIGVGLDRERLSARHAA